MSEVREKGAYDINGFKRNCKQTLNTVMQKIKTKDKNTTFEL